MFASMQKIMPINFVADYTKEREIKNKTVDLRKRDTENCKLKNWSLIIVSWLSY